MALDFINNSSGRSLISQVRVPTEVLTGRFGYGFALGLMLKDLGIANELCDSYYKDAALMRSSLALLTEARKLFAHHPHHPSHLECIATFSLPCSRFISSRGLTLSLASSLLFIST